MKKIVLAGLVMMAVLTADAQAFKKGDAVEINTDFSNTQTLSWVKGSITKVDVAGKRYAVKCTGSKTYYIPFHKEEVFIRRPLQPLTVALKEKEEDITILPSVTLLKQKINESFQSDFSEYDSVILSFDKIETLAVYKNSDNGTGKAGSQIYPFEVDFTLRLVNKNNDGTQRKINWQFKRRYLLYQNQKGKCSISIADKEESLLSHI